MAEGHQIFIKCPSCLATGKVTITGWDPANPTSLKEITCTHCQGEKYLLWGYMTKDDVYIPGDLPIEEE